MDVSTTLVLVLAAVAAIVLTHRVAERTGLPEPALLTLIGIAYAVLPGPNVELDPHLVLTLLIPPLLYSAALDSSLLAIRHHLRTVISLSVVLVLATALLVGAGFALFVTGATLAAGVALGAAIAPPDPVAALAVGRKVGLPPRLLTLVQGEGLLNDATALTLLTVAVSAATGDGYSTWAAAATFVAAAAGGVVVGLVVAWAVRWTRRWSQDPLILNAISLTTPFVAYLVGEELHVSGVLAVVIAGLAIGHDSPRSISGASRLQVNAVWRLVSFLLEGFVFLLIGQQLPTVLDGLHLYATSTIVIAVAISVGVALLLRPLWLIVTQWLPRRLSAREVLVLSWSGTRGVITLAAVYTLPITTDSGEPFPDRNLMIFCAFVVVLVTLVGQGMTFGPLVRVLGLQADSVDQARLRNEARSAAARAGLARLEELQGREHEAGEDDAIATLRTQLEHRLERYQQRLDVLEDADGELPASASYEAAVRLHLAVIEAEREELLRMRETGQLPDASLRVLERELDHREVLLPARHR